MVNSQMAEQKRKGGGRKGATSARQGARGTGAVIDVGDKPAAESSEDEAEEEAKEDPPTHQDK